MLSLGLRSIDISRAFLAVSQSLDSLWQALCLCKPRLDVARAGRGLILGFPPSGAGLSLLHCRCLQHLRVEPATSRSRFLSHFVHTTNCFFKELLFYNLI